MSTGVNVRAGERLELGAQLNWTGSTAAMRPIDLSAPQFTARVPLMPFDFAQTWTYSDLDVSNFDAGLEARYQVNDRTSLRGAYRYVDYADDAPYLYDTSGRNHLFSISVGWRF